MKIAKWDTWQSYRSDRGAPPWIKVHRNLMSNADWAVLSDSEKGQLISLWIVAADKGGELPDDPRILMKICQLDEPPNISKFIELDFIESYCLNDDANLTPTGSQDDSPDKIRGEKSRVEESRSICRFEEFWLNYPKKVGKKSVKAIWIRRKLDEQADMIIADLMNRNQNDRKWIDGFAPNPSTYLNGDRWEDEIEAKAIGNGKFNLSEALQNDMQRINEREMGDGSICALESDIPGQVG